MERTVPTHSVWGIERRSMSFCDSEACPVALSDPTAGGELSDDQDTPSSGTVQTKPRRACAPGPLLLDDPLLLKEKFFLLMQEGCYPKRRRNRKDLHDDTD